jgi:Tfp pilus assembly PilM family ATPase
VVSADLKFILLQATRSALFLTPVKSGRRASFGVPLNFELPENLRLGRVYSDISVFAKFVSGCVNQAGFGTKKIVFCIEDDNVICKEYQHLPCKSKNLLSFAKLEAESVLSDNIDDYLIQNYEYGRQNEVTGKMTSSLFAAKSVLISEIKKSFSKYDLHVMKIVPPVSGLLYAAKTAIDSKGKTVAVLDLSFEKTRLIVLHEGFPIFLRTFEAIYDDIIEILIKSKGLSYRDTVELIQNYGVYGVSSANPASQDAGQITTLLDACASEAVRNIRMVLSSERLELNKMVLCGSMSTLPNFGEFWNQLDLDIPIDTVDLCAATSTLPEVNREARKAGCRISSFFTVSGLLSAKKADDIDFLNTVKAKTNARTRNVAVLALITAIALGVMALEPLLYSSKLSQNAQDKAALTDVKYTEIKELLNTQNELNTQLSHGKSDQKLLPQDKSKTIDVTQQLFEQVTAKAKSVDTFNVDNSVGIVTLSFETGTYSDYLTIKKEIESNGYFVISIPFTVAPGDTGKYVCSVTLSWKDFVPLSPSSKGGASK